MSTRLPASRAVVTSPRRGFTLIELLTVFIIAGLLMGLTARGVGPFIMQQRLDKAANAMTNDIREGFAVAARNRRPVRVVLDTTAMQLSLTDRALGTVLRRTTFGAGFGLQSKNVLSIYPSVPFDIYPNGLASDSMVISFQSGAYRRQVKVSRAGMIQVRNN